MHLLQTSQSKYHRGREQGKYLLKMLQQCQGTKRNNLSYGLRINDLETKGYETLIYKQSEKTSFYYYTGYHIFRARAGNRLPNNDTFKLELGLEISMIIKINAKSRYLLDKLLSLLGGNEIRITKSLP